MLLQLTEPCFVEECSKLLEKR